VPVPPLPIDIALEFGLLSLVVLGALSILLVKHSTRLWWVVAVFVGWGFVTALLAVSGVLSDFDSRPPWIPILVLTQLTFVVWLACFSSWSNILIQIPQFYLIALQCFRIPVELLLAALAVQQLLAIEMTFYGRNFDILAGITAVMLAMWLRRQGEDSQRLTILAWNMMGLSLVTAVLVQGILSVPYPFQSLHLSVPTFVIAYFPVVWLLTLLVPIAYFLHLVSIRRSLAARLHSIDPI
jgi:hypothetical protein